MKKTSKQWLLSAGLILSVLLTSGCNQTATTQGSSSSADSQTSTSETVTTESSTRTFVDSAGRSVEIPDTISAIAPSGPLAQIVLYTSAPDLLAGIASPFSDAAKEYIDQKYYDLPVFGQFYGKNANLNMEALSAAKPDVIIDIGEKKDTVTEDMDNLQEQLQIPTIFIEATLDNMATTYEKLGELFGNQTEMQALSEYCEDVLANADKISSELTDSEKKTVYYATGDAGLNTNATGSVHTQVIDKIGAVNAAEGIEAASSGGGSLISLEQLLQWQPDYIIAGTQDLYDLITTDESWQQLTAVQEGNVYRIPDEPYNFINTPPSVNQIIGIQWLGNLIYPEKYDFDIKEEIQTFYDLFYHVSITDDQMTQLLNNAE
ncbi:ABC transporter substrate-binding protein [Enterococcus sp. HY326]|uniref:ABC transporter substrate-binding protein n=1 Tax=Enterococcus sp. HY326 TaxID=2971265 RepID=UPI00223EBD27|nr:ABC transporter substrate-binding protein [Enterococcus sp. HY326]